MKGILVTCNKLIVTYEVFLKKYLSSIDEELVMPVMQDLDQDPKTSLELFENLHIWGFGASTDGNED